MNFEKENLIIELSDSEEAFEAYKGYDESEIKKIINKDSQIFNIDTQIENLLKLISKNADSIRFIIWIWKSKWLIFLWIMVRYF